MMTKRLSIPSILFLLLGLLSTELRAQDKPQIEVKLGGKIADLKAGISIKKLPEVINVKINYPQDSISKVELTLVRYALPMSESDFKSIDELNKINFKNWLEGKLEQELYKRRFFSLELKVGDRIVIALYNSDEKLIVVWNDHFVE